MAIMYLLIGLIFGYTFKTIFDEGAEPRGRQLRAWREEFPLTRYHYNLMETLNDVHRVGYQPIYDECNLIWDMYLLGLVQVKIILPGVGTLYVLSKAGTELYVYYRDQKGGLV